MQLCQLTLSPVDLRFKKINRSMLDASQKELFYKHTINCLYSTCNYGNSDVKLGSQSQQKKFFQ